ncbi:hypothetical protein [Paenibacillus chitinolyticus]|uniref:hypothetical protein n=1 Tax=Paenibacillus chitinolyticus TaxID=79263 RepID=UPI00362877BE
MDRFIISSSPRALNKRAADINRNVIKTGRLLADFQLIIGEEGQANPCPESNLTPNVFDRRLFFKRKTEKTDKKKDARNFTVWTRVRAAGLDKISGHGSGRIEAHCEDSCSFFRQKAE